MDFFEFIMDVVNDLGGALNSFDDITTLSPGPKTVRNGSEIL